MNANAEPSQTRVFRKIRPYMIVAPVVELSNEQVRFLRYSNGCQALERVLGIAENRTAACVVQAFELNREFHERAFEQIDGGK